MSQIAARYESLDAIWFDETLRDALPNVLFSVDGASPEPAYARVIEGTVVAVAKEASYRDAIDEDDNADPTELPFDSPDATWRAVVLTVEIDNDFDSTTDAASSVDVAVTFSATADPATFMKGFENQHIFAVLDPPGLVLADESLHTVGRAGALIGQIGEDGSISLPALGEKERDYVAGLTTVSTLQAAADEPDAVIRLTTDGGLQRQP